MYLRGLGALTVKMPDGSTRQATAVEAWVHDALKSGGQALRPNGSVYQFQEFMGGVLLDGCPLNVILGQGWLPGQQDALRLANIGSFCAEAAPSGPVMQVFPPPTVQQIPAPGYQQPASSGSGARILTTGVATPSGPLIISTPGGGMVYEPAAPAEPGEPPAQEAGFHPLLAIGLGLGLLFAVSRKKGR